MFVLCVALCMVSMGGSSKTFKLAVPPWTTLANVTVTHDQNLSHSSEYVSVIGIARTPTFLLYFVAREDACRPLPHFAWYRHLCSFAALMSIPEKRSRRLTCATANHTDQHYRHSVIQNLFHPIEFTLVIGISVGAPSAFCHPLPQTGRFWGRKSGPLLERSAGEGGDPPTVLTILLKIPFLSKIPPPPNQIAHTPNTKRWGGEQSEFSQNPIESTGTSANVFCWICGSCKMFTVQ